MQLSKYIENKFDFYYYYYSRKENKTIENNKFDFYYHYYSRKKRIHKKKNLNLIIRNIQEGNKMNPMENFMEHAEQIVNQYYRIKKQNGQLKVENAKLKEQFKNDCIKLTDSFNKGIKEIILKHNKCMEENEELKKKNEQLKKEELELMNHHHNDEDIEELQKENEKLDMENEKLTEKVKELTTHKNILLLECSYQDSRAQPPCTTELVKIAKKELSNDDFEEWKEWYEVNDEGEKVEDSDEESKEEESEEEESEEEESKEEEKNNETMIRAYLITKNITKFHFLQEEDLKVYSKHYKYFKIRTTAKCYIVEYFNIKSEHTKTTLKTLRFKKP